MVFGTQRSMLYYFSLNNLNGMTYNLVEILRKCIHGKWMSFQKYLLTLLKVRFLKKSWLLYKYKKVSTVFILLIN